MIFDKKVYIVDGAEKFFDVDAEVWLKDFFCVFEKVRVEVKECYVVDVVCMVEDVKCMGEDYKCM